jgi:CRISPR-associated protein Cas1
MMLKQTLFFSTPVRLSLRNRQLVISRKDSDEIITRPIEDIGFVVIENQMTSVSIPLFNELVSNNVSVIICNEKCMPSSMLMGLNNNATQAESLKYQLDVTEPSRKQAWKQLVEQKIRNQAAVLDKVGIVHHNLKSYYNSVLSGDSSNREGLAARQYWSHLFGKDFRREREGLPPNNLLNYGYSILRAATARALIGSGLLPALGLFHRNRYNAFPLADDIMEPYRPYVDEIVFGAAEEGLLQLDKQVKVRLLKLLVSDVKIGNVTRPLSIALTTTSASLLKYYKGETKKLTLPIFV